MSTSEADNLERIIAHLDSLYELGEECIHPETGEEVTDGEYDAMRRRLATLRPTSKIFSETTASKVNLAVKKVKHNPPMTSIAKASHEDRAKQFKQLNRWLYACREITSGFTTSYKVDGLACGLYYEEGIFVRAGLRPRDGINGEDVTEQARYVKGIPLKLPVPITCSIRGEVVCKLSDFATVQSEFKRLGLKPRANPRNHAAGGIRQFKEPQKVEMMRLSFIGHAIENLDNPPYQTELERAEWCLSKLGIQFVEHLPLKLDRLGTIEEAAKKLNYNTDGIVISVNSLEEQEQLGRHGDSPIGTPRGKIAWKFAEERATPIVKSIEYKTGRTGAIKPVSIFGPVPLGGTHVKRATLHNLGYIFRNQIEVGTQIVVLKAGNIIPKVVGVEANKAKFKAISDVQYPRQCPACGGETQVAQFKEMYELICRNPMCSAQSTNGLQHYLATVGVLGLGESKVTSLVEAGLVKIPADFYTLTLEQVTSSDLSERQALLALAGIHMIGKPDQYENNVLHNKIKTAMKSKKAIPLWKVIGAFGMDKAGRSTGKALVDHFSSFDAIRNASVAQLEEVPDVGLKTAEVIHAYFQLNREAVDKLLNFVEPELPKAGGKFDGLTFVLSGGFNEGKSYWESAIENLGGKCSSSTSKKTSYLVEGVNAGAKAEKARQLGVTILSPIQLKEMVEE